jgi:predicted TPR repeat methyltransferase
MDAVAAHWDAKAADWDANLREAGCHLNEDDAYERFLAQLALVVEQRREFCREQGIIDAGCATGLVLARAADYFAWGIGVDISPRMIELARAKDIAKTTFLVGDCFDLPALCPKAGALVSRGVLLSHYGLGAAETLLRSLQVCLVAGGFLLCDFLNLTSRTRYRHVARNKYYYEGEQVRAVAERAGFRESRICEGPERRVGLLYAEK